MIEREKIFELVAQELEDANRIYPLFHSPHEACAVLKEEVEEVGYEIDWINKMLNLMWIDVKSDVSIENNADSIYAHAVNGIRELIQVCAMTEKIKMSNLYEEK